MKWIPTIILAVLLLVHMAVGLGLILWEHSRDLSVVHGWRG